MANESDGCDAAAAGDPWGRQLCRRFAELAAIAAIFAAAGAWPVPDVNETVYFTKARHAADPTYAAGDFFLETPDAHGVFYLLLGPLAATLPLETAAWIGRLAGWLALAIGFRHLARPLLTGPPARGAWARIAAAALFSVGLRFTSAAGEWVIGGCEAKVFAWALVLGGVGELVRGRSARAWCLLGGATAFHPIVGGWAMVAAVAASAWSWRQPRGIPLARARGLLWPLAGLSGSPGATVALLLSGAVLAAAGVVPAILLSAGVDAATRAEAARIYVVERLHHHLLPRTFPVGFIPRHVLAIIAWWLLDRLANASVARARLTRFTLAALGISLTGLAIAACEPWAPATVHGLLRFYWFRLADVAVPLALALATAAVLADDVACGRLFPLSPRVVRGLVSILLLADLAAESKHWPLPGRALVARGDSKVESGAWADICGWVRRHVPPGTSVLTPRGAASFTWLTGLPEVVAWKNSPQDAASLVEWRKRITDCFSSDGTIRDMERSTAALGESRMRQIADRYGARIAIVPLDCPGLAELPFERLHANDRYVVIELAH
ncbi:MAG: DUF6798 domain-containing protein [Planctomycetota bacterium]